MGRVIGSPISLLIFCLRELASGDARASEQIDIREGRHAESGAERRGRKHATEGKRNNFKEEKVYCKT